MAARAPERYSLAVATAVARSWPLARFAAMALDKVQPVPWVLGFWTVSYTHLVLPGPLGQLAQAHQLLYLAHVGGVGQAAGPAGVPQGDGHVVLCADRCV